MDLQTKPIGQLIEESFDQLPGFRRRFAKRIWQFTPQRVKDERIEKLGFHLASDQEFCTYCTNAPEAFGSEKFTSETPITFDPANLVAILELILEYLPLFLNLFRRATQLLLPLLALCLAGSAQAQSAFPFAMFVELEKPVLTAPTVKFEGYTEPGLTSISDLVLQLDDTAKLNAPVATTATVNCRNCRGGVCVVRSRSTQSTAVPGVTAPAGIALAPGETLLSINGQPVASVPSVVRSRSRTVYRYGSRTFGWPFRRFGGCGPVRRLLGFCR